MSMTETTEAPGTAPAGSTTTDVPVLPSELAGLAGWLSTADHKRVGRMYLVTSLAFLVVGGVVGAILGVERIDSGLALVSSGSFEQLHTFHGEVAVLLFLVPFFLGLATYLVPLQVGAPDIAFPRGAAAAYWTYLASGLVLVGAYAADGGITGGDAVAVDLYLLSLIALATATCVALGSVLTTIVTERAPGMTLLRTPLFTWSILVGGGLTLLTSPVLIARLIELLIAHRYGGEVGSYADISWFWSVPTVYLLVVPAAGVALEIVPVIGASRYRVHAAGIIVLGAMGALGFGAFVRLEEATSGIGSLVFVAMGLASLLPALALVGLLGDTLRRGRLTLSSSLLLALGAVVLLFLGALAGAASVIEPLELDGMVWQVGQIHLTLYGGAVLGAFAALWYWAPKIWGVHLGELAGKAVFALTFLGALLLAAPDLVAGLVEDQAVRSATLDGNLLVGLNVVSLVGGVLGILGVLVAVGSLLSSVGRGNGVRATADPWGGHTLEWATTSPPPPGNFVGTVPVVTSPTPVLDARSDTEVPA
ncbi:MAG TPA: cbb3-type cytochrome c oxidase subunit I [Acidimicrobiales bacterium]|nr:cbb3-type cytochrome c oxidase subunit I [Acidimicrobiales bacterium]